MKREVEESIQRMKCNNRQRDQQVTEAMARQTNTFMF